MRSCLKNIPLKLSGFIGTDFLCKKKKELGNVTSLGGKSVIGEQILIDWLIDFNGMSTDIGLFHAWK